MPAEKVEVAAAIGLQDLASVELGIAALGYRRRSDRTARQLLLADQEIQAALGHREPDMVAVRHLGFNNEDIAVRMRGTVLRAPEDGMGHLAGHR